MSINDYMLNPPKNIIEKFQEVTIINPTYNEALTTVKKMSIRSKFEEEFERIEENKGIEGNWCSRTVYLMDATSLMTNLLHKCKNTVNIMFECAFKVSKDNNINTDSFQIQFVEYQSSPWETKPDNLRAFMNTIEVERGWNN
ncbi:unnamed protein product [Rotaria sordida]|uniref:Uncharacterized protein n=1 Tax=Rotaria sordida TaxID=392033 RepID=A0A814U5B2_9BILA|nr:unnamed protein product [Rotaria sordida]CAF1425888.1 unnamed protein product [Rotaria sordida]